MEWIHKCNSVLAMKAVVDQRHSLLVVMLHKQILIDSKMMYATSMVWICCAIGCVRDGILGFVVSEQKK